MKKLWNVEKRLGGWKEIQRDFFEDDVSGRGWGGVGWGWWVGGCSSMPILGLGCSVVEVPPALRCLPASAALLSLTRLPASCSAGHLLGDHAGCGCQETHREDGGAVRGAAAGAVQPPFTAVAGRLQWRQRRDAGARQLPRPAACPAPQFASIGLWIIV